MGLSRKRRRGQSYDLVQALLLSQYILFSYIAFICGVQGLEGLPRALLIPKILTKFLFVHSAFRTLVDGGTNSHDVNSETLVGNHPFRGEAAHPMSQTVANIVKSAKGILRLFTAVSLPDCWGHKPIPANRIENKYPNLHVMMIRTALHFPLKQVFGYGSKAVFHSPT